MIYQDLADREIVILRRVQEGRQEFGGDAIEVAHLIAQGYIRRNSETGELHITSEGRRHLVAFSRGA